MPAHSDLAAHLTIADAWVTVCAARAAGLHVEGLQDMRTLFDAAPTLDDAGFCVAVDKWQEQYGRGVHDLALKLFTPALLPASWVTVPGRSTELLDCHHEFWRCAASLLAAIETQSEPQRRQNIAGAADVVFMLYNHAVTTDSPLPFMDAAVEEVLYVPAMCAEFVAALGAPAARSLRRVVEQQPVLAVPALADLWDFAVAQPWVWPALDPSCLTGWRRAPFPTRSSVASLLARSFGSVPATVARTPAAAFASWEDDESAVLWLCELGLLPVHPATAELFMSLRASSLDVAAVCTTIKATLHGLAVPEPVSVAVPGRSGTVR